MCQVASEDLLPRVLLVLSGARVWTKLSGQRPVRGSSSSFLGCVHLAALPLREAKLRRPFKPHACCRCLPSLARALLGSLGTEVVTLERGSDVVRLEEGKKEKILA